MVFFLLIVVGDLGNRECLDWKPWENLLQILTWLISTARCCHCVPVPDALWSLAHIQGHGDRYSFLCESLMHYSSAEMRRVRTARLWVTLLASPSIRWKRRTSSFKRTSNTHVRKCSFRLQNNNYGNMKEDPHISVWFHVLHTWAHTPEERNPRWY